jgi:muramoyltetrapeptide carboxypeptidase LdcA involved in peptidoglycan recycling
LRLDGTIAIVAPSSPILPETQLQFDAGVRRLEGMGFRVRAIA